MEYKFNSKHLNIINVLIFDGSIDYENISGLKLENGKLVFEIERRAFENSTRKWVKNNITTYYGGKKSILTFNDVLSFSVLESGKYQYNHFIDMIEFVDKNQIVLYTTFAKIILNVKEYFTITLKDIEDSDFGKGSLSGIKFFTNEEWLEYLKKEDYPS